MGRDDSIDCGQLVGAIMCVCKYTLNWWVYINHMYVFICL